MTKRKDPKPVVVDLDQALKTYPGRKGQGGLTRYGAMDVKPGDNAKMLKDAIAFHEMELPPIDTRDPKQVNDRIFEYYDFCIDHDVKPTLMGIANWLGVSTDTLNRWRRGETRKDSGLDQVIERHRAILEDLMQQYMMNNKIMPANGIFLLKNMYGYKDQVDHVVAKEQPLGELEDKAALEQRITAALGPAEEDK